MNSLVTIDGKKIGPGYPVYVVAEMSANHLQSYERAKDIIFAAKNAGADAVKLQSYTPDTITIDCHSDDFMATKGSIWEGKNLHDLYSDAYMPWDWHEGLFNYDKEIGITIFSSPFDFTSIDLLEKLGAPAYKIASYEIMDIPLIECAAKTGKPIILSTGVASMADIELAMETCRKAGNEDVILLKCVSEYPTPYKDFNLKTIPNMHETFDCIVGLSDHSMGSAVDIAATTLGASMIEKHMTLRRADGGPDGSFSMEPEEIQSMINDIRNIELSLGVCTYNLNDFQLKGKKNSRSLYVVKDIKAGEEFSLENIRSIRPGYGIKPKYLYDIIGKKANRDLSFGTALDWKYIDD